MFVKEEKCGLRAAWIDPRTMSAEASHSAAIDPAWCLTTFGIGCRWGGPREGKSASLKIKSPAQRGYKCQRTLVGKRNAIVPTFVWSISKAMRS
jgi:hypothetical protein